MLYCCKCSNCVALMYCMSQTRRKALTLMSKKINANVSEVTAVVEPIQTNTQEENMTTEQAQVETPTNTNGSMSEKTAKQVCKLIDSTTDKVKFDISEVNKLLDSLRNVMSADAVEVASKAMFTTKGYTGNLDVDVENALKAYAFMGSNLLDLMPTANALTANKKQQLANAIDTINAELQPLLEALVAPFLARYVTACNANEIGVSYKLLIDEGIHHTGNLGAVKANGESKANGTSTARPRGTSIKANVDITGKINGYKCTLTSNDTWFTFTVYENDSESKPTNAVKYEYINKNDYSADGFDGLTLNMAIKYFVSNVLGITKAGYNVYQIFGQDASIYNNA